MDIQSLLLDTIHHTAEGITLADMSADDMPLIFVNDAFCRMTGYSHEEALGRNCRFLQGKQTNLDTVDAISQCVRSRSMGVFELENHRKDGTVFWNRLSLTPIFKGKEAMCYAGIQSDVTLQKTALNVVERHHENLVNMMGLLSGDMRESLKKMVHEIEDGTRLYDSAKHLTHQLSLLVTMLETDSIEIMQLVKSSS